MQAATAARQQRLVGVYDAEIWPLVHQRAGALLLDALPRRPATVAVDAGCGTGALTLAVAERLDDASRVLAFDPTPGLVDLARARAAAHPAGARVTFEAADLGPPLPVEDGAYDLALSNVTLGEAREPEAALAALARTLRPGGRALATVLLAGSWAEPLDILREVLAEEGHADAVAALEAHRASLPDAATAARWLEAAGLADVTVATARWEVLFRSAREFFFAPLVELGPLPRWKLIAGGRGEKMQDVFFFAKQAIERYFSGRAFAVTIAAACIGGRR